MKGALLDYITSLLDRIAVATRLGYKTRYELADLEDDDLVTKYLLTNSIPPPTPDPIPIDIGDDNPLVIPYSETTSPSYTLLRGASALVPDSFDWNTSVIYDGANFIITGDGGATFADDFVFTIKP